jgi:hypothetical protein
MSVQCERHQFAVHHETPSSNSHSWLKNRFLIWIPFLLTLQPQKMGTMSDLATIADRLSIDHQFWAYLSIFFICKADAHTVSVQYCLLIKLFVVTLWQGCFFFQNSELKKLDGTHAYMLVCVHLSNSEVECSRSVFFIVHPSSIFLCRKFIIMYIWGL